MVVLRRWLGRLLPRDREPPRLTFAEIVEAEARREILEAAARRRLSDPRGTLDG